MTGVRSWPGVLTALLAGTSLERADTAWAMNEIMSGQATPAQVAGFAVALRAKGVAPQELAGMAAAMLDHAEPITVTDRAVDLVGTGGDGAHTVNISTMGAVVAAGAGARVVKHGNRAASSSCGAADLLDELGVSIDLLGAAVARCVCEVGIGFCFAPRFHPALRHAAGPRRELGIPTPFNFLGPVTNPAQPPAMAVGCADAAMAEVIARVLADRGADGLVFRGEDGLDELSVAAPSRVWWIREGTVEAGRLDPAEMGIARSALDALRGGDAAYNAKVARAVFAGERGAVRDAVILNAAAAIAAYEGRADPDGLRDGLARAAESIDTGAAAGVLDRWVALCATL